MVHFKTLLFSFFILSTLNSTAQKINAEKIIGCWLFKEIQFNKQNNFSKEIIKQVEKSAVCFSVDGKFTATKTEDGFAPVMGTFKISDDGKTLIQKRDISEEGTVDDDAEIDFLDDKLLIFKLEFGKISFARK